MKQKFAILFIFLVTFSGCNRVEKKYSEKFLSFDSYIELVVYTNDEKQFTELYNITKDGFDYYHKLFDAFNLYDGINNVKIINDNAGIKPVKVEPVLFNLIVESIELYDKGYTNTNIAFGPITSEYNKLFDENLSETKQQLPDLDLLIELNKCTNINDIVLDYDDSSIYLKNKCNKLDLGGVAKGYATDLIISDLKKSGFENGILIAGQSNIYTIGAKPDGSLFNVGISNPVNQELLATLSISDKHIIASSGEQRYIMIDNERIHHLIDPNTLRPANINQGVTLVTDSGFIGDFLSTHLFMLEKDEFKKITEELSLDYILIDNNGEIIISDGISDAIKVK